jgi:hypothetical protein
MEDAMARRTIRVALAIATLAPATTGAAFAAASGIPTTGEPGHARAARGAVAATATPFGCRASAVRVTAGSTLLEPIVANAGTYPCSDSSRGVGSLSLPTSGSGSLVAGPAGAFTYATGSVGGQTAPGAAAVAQIQGVTIPTSSGLITIGGPVQANADYECSNQKLVGYGQSTLDVVYVNGHPDRLPAPGKPATIQLGGGAYIAANEQIKTASSITERVLDIHLSNSSEIVLGEAEVTLAGSNPCQGVTGPPPGLEICPPGSTLNVVAQYCEIVLPGQVIIVSRPFKGPSGGTVVPLSTARKRYHSSCLYGRGPRYALIATKRGGRVTGTLYSDRILALGAYERVAGLGGDDCIDGRGGNQRLFDGNGNDRIYAAGGYNRIAVGNGNDYINGRNGRDYITAGNGRDVIYGGRGGSSIVVGIGHDRLYGRGRAHNRIWAGGDFARVSCGPGPHNTAFVRRRAARYAHSHGCQMVRLLH